MRAEPLGLCVIVPSLLNGWTLSSPALYQVGHWVICLFGRLHCVRSLRGRWVPRVQVTLAPTMWAVPFLLWQLEVNWFQVWCCISHIFESGTAWVLFIRGFEFCIQSVSLLGFFKSVTFWESSFVRWKSCACCSILMEMASRLLSLSTWSTACGGRPSVSCAKQRNRHDVFFTGDWALSTFVNQRACGSYHAPWVDCSTWHSAPLFF